MRSNMMIDPSNGMKIKRYVTLADIGHKEQYDDRPFKWHENKKVCYVS